MRILIAGATGATGRILTKKVADAGHTPVAMVRESSDTSVLPDGCETVTADLSNLNDSIVENIDVVVFAAGSGGDTSKEMTDAIDRNGAKSLIGAAQSRGVGRFVMLSSIGADQPENAPESMQHYLDAKHEADEYLKQSDMEYMIVRPVALTNNQESGKMRAGESVARDAEVSRADVAEALLLSAISPAHINKTFEMAEGGLPTREAYAAL